MDLPPKYRQTHFTSHYLYTRFLTSLFASVLITWRHILLIAAIDFKKTKIKYFAHTSLIKWFNDSLWTGNKCQTLYKVSTCSTFCLHLLPYLLYYSLHFSHNYLLLILKYVKWVLYPESLHFPFFSLNGIYSSFRSQLKCYLPRDAFCDILITLYHWNPFIFFLASHTFSLHCSFIYSYLFSTF